MTTTDDLRSTVGSRRTTRSTHQDRTDTPAPERVGLGQRARWRRGATRRLTVRRVVALARFAVGTGLDPELSETDEVVRRAVRVRAEGLAHRAARRLDRMGRRSAALAERAVDRRADADGSEHVVHDTVAGAVTVGELRGLQRAGRGRILAARAEGDRSHDRPGRGHRLLAAALPWLDAALFGYFVSGVVNADLAAPLTTPVTSAVTLALTLLVVLVLAGFTPWLGRRLRSQKDGGGEFDWSRLGPLSTVLLGLWSLLVLAIGATMAVRIVQEAGYAGASPAVTAAVATLLALCAVAMAGYVLGVAFADGSVETDDLARRSRTIRRAYRRRRRLLRAADRLDLRRHRTDRAAEARRRRAVRSVLRVVGDGERMLHVARLRTGVRRPAGEPVVPEIEMPRAAPSG